MAADLLIISGFLGAGKTTLIKKLITEGFKNENIVIIENDFGDASVDASLLRTPNIEVKELSSGCICCSLSGDFVRSLLDVLKRFRPTKILIEPSGVSKVSDIIKSCSDPRVRKLASLKSVITVVDAKRCKKHLNNFGEFFEDQIKNADVILLSHTEASPDSERDARSLVKSLNEKSAIIAVPWHQLTPQQILDPEASLPSVSHTYSRQGMERKSCNHKGDCCCHHHSANEVFETLTIKAQHKYSVNDLKKRVEEMEHHENGTILRVKGIVPGVNGYINLQYVPGETVLTSTTVTGNDVCIIGRNLDRNRLMRIFNGE
ncbi:MAG: CobW family GTP-binding protein [Lacrimispora sp.]